MPQVYVYEEFSSGAPKLMGFLYLDVLRGQEGEDIMRDSQRPWTLAE